MTAEAGKIPAKVLVLHGADDPFVPGQEVTAFQEEMTKALSLLRGQAVETIRHRDKGGEEAAP